MGVHFRGLKRRGPGPGLEGPKIGYFRGQIWGPKGVKYGVPGGVLGLRAFPCWISPGPYTVDMRVAGTPERVKYGVQKGSRMGPEWGHLGTPKCGVWGPEMG